MMVLPLKIFVIIIFASVNIVFICGTVAMYNKYGRQKHPWFPNWLFTIEYSHIMMMEMVYLFADAVNDSNFDYLYDQLRISNIIAVFTVAYYVIPRMIRAYSNHGTYKVEGFRELSKYYFVVAITGGLYVFWFSLTLYIIITH